MTSEGFRQRQLELYHSIMEEAKTRVDAINVVLRGPTGLAERAAAEFCFLQIRMLCELTAPSHGQVSHRLPDAEMGMTMIPDTLFSA